MFRLFFYLLAVRNFQVLLKALIFIYVLGELAIFLSFKVVFIYIHIFL